MPAAQEAIKGSKDKTDSKAASENGSGFSSILKFFYINEVPSYGNNFFFTMSVYLTASKYGLRASQWGMIKAGGAWWQIGSYWAAQYNYPEIITNGIPWWGDLENGVIAVIFFAILLFLPIFHAFVRFMINLSCIRYSGTGLL